MAGPISTTLRLGTGQHSKGAFTDTRQAATRQKFFEPCLFYFTVHRSRENLQNRSTFTYIIILVALSLVACRVSANAP